MCQFFCHTRTKENNQRIRRIMISMADALVLCIAVWTGKDRLYQMADQFLPVAGQIVDDGNFYHGVGTGLLAHGGTGGID